MSARNSGARLGAALLLVAGIGFPAARAGVITVENAPPGRLAFVSGNDLLTVEKGAMSAVRIQGKDWISPSSPKFLDPDGETLLFSAHKRERFGPNRGEINIDKSDLYLMTDTGFRPLTEAGDLSLAPDAVRGGEDIVFVSNRHARLRGLMPGTSTMELYLLSAPATMPERLTRDGGFKYNPRWSPDGTKVAYLWLMQDSTGIYIENVLQRDSPVRVAASGDYPTWRPDGTALVYAARGKLYEVKLDGERAPRMILPESFHGFASFPRWTPHGIVFQWARASKQGIALLNPVSHEVTVLISTEDECGGADLSEK